MVTATGLAGMGYAPELVPAILPGEAAADPTAADAAGDLHDRLTLTAPVVRVARPGRMPLVFEGHLLLAWRSEPDLPGCPVHGIDLYEADDDLVVVAWQQSGEGRRRTLVAERFASAAEAMACVRSVDPARALPPDRAFWEKPDLETLRAAELRLRQLVAAVRDDFDALVTAVFTAPRQMMTNT